MPRAWIHLVGPTIGLGVLAGVVLAANRPAGITIEGEAVRFEYSSHGHRDPFIPLFIPTPTPKPTVSPTPYQEPGSELAYHVGDAGPLSTRIPPPKLPLTGLVFSSHRSLLVLNDRVFREGDVVPLDDGTSVRIERIEPQQVRCVYFDEPFVIELPRARR